MIADPFEYIIDFNIKDLHEEVGQILVFEPSDSDINEGNFMRTVWFRTADMKWYQLIEEDIRNVCEHEPSSLDCNYPTSNCVHCGIDMKRINGKWAKS